MLSLKNKILFTLLVCNPLLGHNNPQLSNNSDLFATASMQKSAPKPFFTFYRKTTYGRPVSYKVKNFVYAELRLLNVKDYQKIEVRCISGTLYAAVIKRVEQEFMGTKIYQYMLFTQDIIYEVERILSKHEKTIEDNQKLNQFRFLIRHEGRHIKYNHALKKEIIKMLFLLSSPLPSIATIATWEQEDLSLIQKSLFTSGAVLTTLLTYKPVLRYVSRYHEKNADYDTNDSIEVLQGGIEYFERLKKFIAKNPNQKNINNQISSSQIYKLIKLPITLAHTINNFFDKHNPTHPSLDERIKRLQDRIAVLEKEQQK